MSEKIISIPFLNTFVQQSTESTMVNIKSIVDIVNQKRLTQGKHEISIGSYLDTEGATEYINTHLSVMGIEKVKRRFLRNAFDTKVEYDKSKQGDFAVFTNIEKSSISFHFVLCYNKFINVFKRLLCQKKLFQFHS